MSVIFFVSAIATVLPLWCWPVVEPRPHVRPIDDSARVLVHSGTRQSTTLSRLSQALDTTNVVVYVKTSADLQARGSIYFVARVASTTYLVVRVRAQQIERDRIAALAHELQHALEVAAARTPVASAADFQRLYESIGYLCGERRFETDAARLIEAAVLRELEAAATARRKS